MRRSNKRGDFEQLSGIIREYEVSEIVVGYPLRLSGAQGSQSTKIARFADQLSRFSGLPVHLWDERLTTRQADRVLREAELSIKRRGQAIDRMAAILILQSWLDARDACA